MFRRQTRHAQLPKRQPRAICVTNTIDTIKERWPNGRDPISAGEILHFKDIRSSILSGPEHRRMSACGWLVAVCEATRIFAFARLIRHEREHLNSPQADRFPSMILEECFSRPKIFVPRTAPLIEHFVEGAKSIYLALPNLSVFEHVTNSDKAIVKLHRKFIIAIGFGAFSSSQACKAAIQIRSLIGGGCRKVGDRFPQKCITRAHHRVLASPLSV